MKKIVFSLVVFILLFNVNVLAQSVDTSSYLLMHLFTAAEDAGGRGSALGKVVSILSGENASNPAMMDVKDKAVLVKYGTYNLGDIDSTAFNTLQARYIVRLSKDQVLAINYYGADTGRVDTKMIGMPATKRFQENDISVAYRKNINKNWSWGVAGALLPVSMNIKLPNGMNVVSLTSNVCYGLEPSLAYRSNDKKFSAGFVSQLYVEQSDLTVMGKSYSNRYSTCNNFLGVGFSPNKKDLIVAEIEKGWVVGAGKSIPIEAFKFGYERTEGQIALRIGLSDGQPTYGIGFKNKKISMDLAYLNNPHNDQLKSMGGANALLLSVSSNF